VVLQSKKECSAISNGTDLKVGSTNTQDKSDVWGLNYTKD
jgi:hypothetical protein